MINATGKHIQANTLKKMLNGEKEPYLGSYLTLVGATYIPSNAQDPLPIKPFIDEIHFNGKTVDVNITFTPTPGETTDNELSRLKFLMEYYSLGTAVTDFKAPEVESDLGTDMLLMKSSFSNVQDYVFTTVYDTDTIERATITIAGKTYYEVRLQGSGVSIEATELPFSHDLILLFKEREYDGETFLGGLEGHHNLRDSKKIIEALCKPVMTNNIILQTSLYVRNVVSVLLPETSNVIFQEMDGNYIIKQLGGYTVFNCDELKSITISPAENGTREVTIHLKEQDIVLLMNR